MFSSALLGQAELLLQKCRGKQWALATAESCTGGLISALLTEIPGSSDVLHQGFVTYANEAKANMLAVPETLIAAHGAVSAEVARAMAEGALKVSGANLSVAVTGIAGPDGGTEQKPVGLVHIASACAGRETLHERFQFSGNRREIRLQAVEQAIAMLMRQL